ncbi:hypothetical protein TNCV_1666261 [Trichonephila clavipes]|nr:hypothetical protein TNCV_1666261 [Trichonephila clavipes]
MRASKSSCWRSLERVMSAVQMSPLVQNCPHGVLQFDINKRSHGNFSQRRCIFLNFNTSDGAKRSQKCIRRCFSRAVVSILVSLKSHRVERLILDKPIEA